MADAPSVPDFTLLRRIGGGGYGEVWLGRSVTGVLRAVKIISRARFEDDRPFFRELDGITRFQRGVGGRPRQLALLHVGRDERAGLLYYVMELADDAAGGAVIDPATYVPLTLRELRARRHRLPAADCVRIGTELATALGELHQAGLLHRDVKPSNIIFVDGSAKLADVGLIARSEDMVSSVGTPEYAAPEGTGSVRADLYSLGKILYELATGSRPDEFPRLPADLPHLPDAAALFELNEITLRACHADPAQRYPHAEALLSDLRLLQAGRSVQELNRTRRQLRTLSRAGAVAGALALGVIGVLGVKNYFALRALAAQETAFRKSAEADEQLARYTSDLHFAQLGLVGGDLGAARTALRRQLPQAGAADLRGLEWHALWHQSEGQATRTLGEAGGPPLVGLALSPDGRTVAAIERASPGRAVRLELDSGRRRVIAEDCHRLAGFSADGTQLIVIAGDRTVCTVDVASGAVRRQSVRGRFIGGVGDGRTLFLAHESIDDDTLFLWDAETERRIYQWKPVSSHPNPVVTSAAVTRDSGRIAAALLSTEGSAQIDEIVIHDRSSGQDMPRIEDLSGVRSLRFSPDGALLAVATNTQTFVLQAGNPALRTKVADSGGQVALEFSPDGTRLAIGDANRRLTVCSLRGDRPNLILTGHESAIAAVLWTQDGQKIITGGLDGTCRTWDLNQEVKTNAITGQWEQDLGSVVLSDDGANLAVTGGDGAVRLFATPRLSLQAIVPGAFHPLAFADHDRALLSLSHEHLLIKSDLRGAIGAPVATPLVANSRIMSFGLSPDKDFVALGLDTGDVQIWDLDRLAEVGRLHVCEGDVEAVAVANGGTSIAASDWQGNVWLMSATGRLEETVPIGGAIATSLSFSANGQLLAIGDDRGFLLVWNTRDRKAVATTQAHSAAVDAVFFSRDQSRCLTGGADGLIVAWETTSWRPLAAWSVMTDRRDTENHRIYRLDSDDRGHWLVALTGDGIVQRWKGTDEVVPANEIAAR